MTKNLFIFTKQLGNLLLNIRKKARLSQNDVAKSIGMSPKLGHSYISRLEQGKIKNPFLRTIILYLDACHTPYNTFFSKLSELRFRERQQGVMSREQLQIQITFYIYSYIPPIILLLLIFYLLFHLQLLQNKHHSLSHQVKFLFLDRLDLLALRFSLCSPIYQRFAA